MSNRELNMSRFDMLWEYFRHLFSYLRTVGQEPVSSVHRRRSIPVPHPSLAEWDNILPYTQWLRGKNAPKPNFLRTSENERRGTRNVLLLLIKRYNLYKVLACSTAFFQLPLFCSIFFQLCTFIFLIYSKTSFSQRGLGLPIGLLDMGFHLLIFWTLLSSAMRSIWPNQFNPCFLINPIVFRPFSISLISYQKR